MRGRLTVSQGLVAKQDELLEILEQNRARHQTVYEAAIDGWETAVLKELRAEIKRVRSGKREQFRSRYVVPQNHTGDYDRAILMVKMHQSEAGLFPLTEQFFAQFVMDDWEWKRAWLQNSNMYAAATVQDFYEIEV